MLSIVVLEEGKLINVDLRIDDIFLDLKSLDVSFTGVIVVVLLLLLFEMIVETGWVDCADVVVGAVVAWKGFVIFKVFALILTFLIKLFEIFVCYLSCLILYIRHVQLSCPRVLLNLFQIVYLNLLILVLVLHYRHYLVLQLSFNK